MGFIAIVVAVTVFANMIATTVTSKVSSATIDMTSTALFSISSDTKKMLKKLDSDITIYVMAPKTSADSTIKKTLERYQSTSKHIKVEYKDTTLYPNFYQKYTDTAPTSNSLIVVNEKTSKSKVVDYNDIYVSDSYSYYTSGSNNASSYDCEGQLDSAISYVRSNTTYKIYQIEGHDEAVTDTTNFGSDSNLNYTEDEAKIVINYLNNGGKAIIGLENLTSQGVDKPNFNSILKEFGINVQSGVVAENNTSYYSTQYGPWFAFADGITGYASGLSSYVFAPYTSGLKQVKNSDDSITYTALASTSSDSVLKTNASKATTYKKESGDVDGPFDIVVSVEKTVTTTKTNDDSNKSSDTSNSSEENSDSTDETTTNTASLLVFGSVYSLSDTMDNSVSQSNTQIVNNAMKDYIDTEVETVSVPAKSLSSEQLTVTESGSRLFGILISVVVPVIILLAGIVVWVRRRKR